MAEWLPYTAAQRERIVEAVTAAVAERNPGPVLEADALAFEEIALQALQASQRRPASATPSQLRWVRATVAGLMAQREAGAFR